jgi:hypothetical protein
MSSIDDDKNGFLEGTPQQMAERKRFREILAASLSEGERTERRARRWYWAIVCIGCTMPLLILPGVALGPLLGFLTDAQSRAFFSQGFGPYDPTSLAENAALWLALTSMFDWPFFIYAHKARKRIRTAELNTSVSILPVVLGLIGLSVPYVFMYMFLAPVEFTAPPHSGTGLGYYGPMVNPLIAGIGASIGWMLGRGIAWAMRR